MEPEHHAAGVRAYYYGVQDLDPQGFIELHLPEGPAARVPLGVPVTRTGVRTWALAFEAIWSEAAHGPEGRCFQLVVSIHN
jgi:hypothetical protein